MRKLLQLYTLILFYFIFFYLKDWLIGGWLKMHHTSWLRRWWVMLFFRIHSLKQGVCVFFFNRYQMYMKTKGEKKLWEVDLFCLNIQGVKEKDVCMICQIRLLEVMNVTKEFVGLNYTCIRCICVFVSICRITCISLLSETSNVEELFQIFVKHVPMMQWKAELSKQTLHSGCQFSFQHW